MKTLRLVLGFLFVAVLVALVMPKTQPTITRTSVLLAPESQELMTQMTINSDNSISVVVIDLVSILEKYASEAKEKGKVELEDGTTITAQKIIDPETNESMWRIEICIGGTGACGLITAITKGD